MDCGWSRFLHGCRGCGRAGGGVGGGGGGGVERHGSLHRFVNVMSRMY